MCGIAGILSHRGMPPTAADARRMCAAIRHRGPDDEGVFVDGPLAMGMRRLSIIDLEGGHQPIANEDGSVVVVFNGEIYNYRALRAELEGRGHRFATRSDTEVIVHLYEERGLDFPHALFGMFAIALWDRRERRLVLVRDRLGIKPLAYAAGAGRLVFGSEVKALLAAGVARDLDPQAVHDYLSFGYVPGAQSIFGEVRRLPPGHLLVARGGRVEESRWWSPPAPELEPVRKSAAEWQAELRERLETVVRDHMVADVPVGVFLSGGLDSGTLAALASRSGNGRLHTFSIGFDDPSYDELDDARRVAKRYDTEHHELVVRPDAVALLPELVRAFDEPFADSSAIPVYCVSKLARESVKVVLSGEGGDEVFAGYQTYSAWKWAERYQRLPGVVSRGLVPAIVRRLPVSHRRVSFDYRAKRFVAAALAPPAEAHFGWKVVFDEAEKAALYASPPAAMLPSVRLYRDAWAREAGRDPLARLQRIDQQIYLPDDILVKADRMSMAVSLEARVPFLDHRLVELALSLPPELRLRGGTRKVLLRRAMAADLPREVLRGGKRGFNVPIPAWLNGELRDFAHDVLGTRRLREAGFFRPAAVEALLADHESRRADRSRPLWTLLSFALWHEEFVRPVADEEAPPSRTAARG
jgi:asparagine synthase (glutamine-hydrolysing)